MVRVVWHFPCRFGLVIKISRSLVLLTVAMVLLTRGFAMPGEVVRGGERATQKEQNQNGAKGSSQNGEQQTEIEKLIIRCKADLATVGPNFRQKRVQSTHLIH